jgi:hypothetical protein
VSSSNTVQWVRINDFSAGIVKPGRGGVGGFAPPGSAFDAEGCVSSTSGALVPGWNIVDEISHAPYGDNWTIDYRPAGGRQILCDTAIWSPTVANHDVPIGISPNEDNDFIMMGFEEYYDAAGSGAFGTYELHTRFYGYSMSDGGTGQLDLADNQTTITFAGPDTDMLVGGRIALGRGTSYDRSAGTWTDFTTSPYAIFPIAVWAPSHYIWGSEAFIHYPDLDTDLGVAYGTPIRGTSTAYGGVIAFHAGRLCWISGGGFSHGTNLALSQNAGPLNYTQVMKGSIIDALVAGLAEAATTSQLVFLESQSIVAWILSINANTLYVMTVGDGAYLIRGDLDRPQITKLAGVASPYVPYTGPAATPLGITYGSKEGVYVTTESGESKCISPSLPGDFWDAGFEGYYYPWAPVGKIGYRDPYLMAPNSYIMDRNTNAWWRLPANSEATSPAYLCYETNVNGQVYAFPWYKDATTDLSWVRYDPSEQLKGDGVQWDFTSNYVRELTLDGNAPLVREMELVLSGHGSVIATVVSESTETTTSGVFLIDSDVPIRVRGDVTVHTSTPATPDQNKGASGVYFTLQAIGSSDDLVLPSVHEFSMGFQSGAPLAA